MKISYPILLFTLSTLIASAQNYYEFLDTNNVRARFDASGDLFNTDMLTKPALEMPKDGGKGMLSIGRLWFSGIQKTSFDVLCVAAKTYETGTETDYWAGPVANTYSPYSGPTSYIDRYDSLYNYVWKISKDEIQNHIANYNTLGVVAPWAIANWPGNGLQTLGVADRLAPFDDINGNGIYEPSLGDYPKILGDEMLYFIFNDDRSSHSASGSGSNKFGFEIHGMAYSFNMPSEPYLHNTIFVNYTIFNRSTYNYSDVRMGLWFDKCIGCFEDNQEGSDSILNTFFVYNGLPVDYDCNNGFGARTGYGAYPPAVGVAFLNQPMTGFGVYENNQSAAGNPETFYDYDKYLRSQFKDNTPFKKDCDYYGGTTPANFIFPDDPNDTSGISAYACNTFLGHSLGRVFGVAGPFDIPSNGKICVDVAFTYAVDSAGGHLASVTLMKSQIQEIQSFYSNNTIGCAALSVGTNPEPYDTKPLLKIYPNPVSDILTIQSPLPNTTLTILNTTGRTVMTTFLSQREERQINVSSLPAGIYTLTYKSERNNGTLKFLKQ